MDNNPNQSCNPSWQIYSWNTCTNNVQTRTVLDLNNCNITTNEPITYQSCNLDNSTITCFSNQTLVNGVCQDKTITNWWQQYGLLISVIVSITGIVIYLIEEHK